MLFSGFQCERNLLDFLYYLDFADIVAASMWTRKDIREFKDSVYKEGKDSIIKVGHGETVTVCFQSLLY